MSYRFKEPGHGMGPHSGPNDGMRQMGPNDSKFDERLMGMDVDKPSRDDMDGDSRGPRPPFGRGRRLSPPRDKPIGDRQREFGGYGRDDMSSHGRDRSPIRGFDDRFPDRFKRDEPFPRREEHGRKDRLFGDEDMGMYGRDKFLGGMEGRGRFEGGPGGGNSRFDHPEDPLRHRPLHYPSVPAKGYYKNDMVKPNECEIIVVNKLQRAYAENVEQRMKNLGIQVDLLFLKDEALLVQTIDDIARRGSLYAVVISPLNETHRSVTLNILYGTPQEHRNMPLDDALKLVARNFHDHIRSQREIMDRDKSERGVYSGSFPADREIQFLFKLLTDGRQVSVGEIETVIRYLTERRDKMKGLTGDRAPAPSLQAGPADAKLLPPNKPKDDIEIAQKEQDLENRIMNIISQEEATADPSLGAPTKTSGSNVPGFGPEVSGPRPNQPGPNSNIRVNSPNRVDRPGMNRPGMNQNMAGGGQNQPNLNPMSGNAKQPGGGMGGNMAGSGSNQASGASTYINFDNPSVKKALDSLMQSGPSLLKSLSNTPPASQGMQNSPTNKMTPPGMGSGMGSQRGPGGMGDMGNMGPQRGMGDMGPQRGPGGMGDMGGQQRGSGDMGGPQRGSGGMGDGGPQRGSGGMSDMGGQQRGPGGMGGPQRGGPGGMGGPQRGGPGGMGDMGGPGDMGMRDMGGPGDMGMTGNMGDMGPRGMGDMGPKRGMGDMGQPRGMGDMGPPRGMGDVGPRGPSNMGPRGPGDMGPRGPGSMDDMGPQRGPGGIGGGNMGQRGPGGNMGMQRGLGGMGDGNMGPGMGHSQDSGNMGPPQGMGGRPGPNMGPGPRSGGMGPGSQFQGPQGMYGGGPNMMGNRPPYMGGHMGGQGMGGGPRRY